jgi:hypothetical protein
MHDLKPQTLILRQVMICKDATSNQAPAEEGLFIDLNKMFNGFEFLTNKSDDNKLFIPTYSRPTNLNPAPMIYPFHIKLNAEEIKSQFSISCFKKDGVTPVSFDTGTDGHYKSIDLYFEYQTPQHFETIHTSGGAGFHSTVGLH